MVDSQKPYISVVLMVGTQRERAERALQSVLLQDGLEQAEVLLLDLHPDEYAPLKGSDHARVRLIKPGRDASIEGVRDLRAYAVPLARGEAVAYLEDHAIALQGWLQTLIKDFKAGYGGVAGKPGNLNPGAGISDGAMLLHFAYFQWVTEPQVTTMLPGHDAAFRRDALLSFGDELPTLLTSEILLHWKMAERGHKLLLDPAAVFLHHNEEAAWMTMRGYYLWNLLFGEGRAHVYHWPVWRRVLQFLAIPVVPFVRYFKLLAYLIKHDRPSLAVLLRYAGPIFFTQAASAVGLGIGCLFGAGNAHAPFLEYELNQDRRIHPS